MNLRKALLGKHDFIYQLLYLVTNIPIRRNFVLKQNVDRMAQPLPVTINYDAYEVNFC